MKKNTSDTLHMYKVNIYFTMGVSDSFPFVEFLIVC